MSAPKYFQLGQNLKRLLFERDMKPIDLAREVNLPQPTIHRLVTGKSTRPYRSSLEPIAKFFSVSVQELLGESPELADVLTHQKDLKKSHHLLSYKNSVVKNIPIIVWDDLSQLNHVMVNAKQYVVTIGKLSQASFALLMPDSSMAPFFSKNTLLIFDPKKTAKDRSYILVKLYKSQLYLFRQLLIDGDNRYLKPLNPDLSLFNMRILDERDDIVGVLIEARNRYFPDEE